MPFKFRIDTLHTDSNAYPRGRHLGNRIGLSDVDRKLISDNIKWGVNVFGIIGTMVIWRWPFAETLIVPGIPSISESLVENHSGGSSPMGEDIAVPDIPTIAESVDLSYVLVDDCEVIWAEYADPAVTVSLDAVVYKLGTTSMKFDIGAGAPVGRVATQAYAPMDLTTYKYLKFWFRSSIGLSSGDMKMLLDDTAECVSPIEQLTIGAITANTWTECTLAFATPASLNAIISVGLYMVVDKGAFVVNIDQIRATKGA